MQAAFDSPEDWRSILADYARLAHMGLPAQEARACLERDWRWPRHADVAL